MPIEIPRCVGRISNLSVFFGPRKAFENFCMDIPEHSITVVTGPSGCGKSSLLRSLNRLNDYLPDSRAQGSVKLHFDEAWHDVFDLRIPLSHLRRRVGMLFQNPRVLSTSIYKNVALPLRLVAGLSGKEADLLVVETLQKVHLWEEVKDRLKSPAAALSGGQQQRLCLARALALGPEFLLLDEPTAFLDQRSAGRIEELLLELKGGHTLVVVSHQEAQAERLGDQLVCF